ASMQDGPQAPGASERFAGRRGQAPDRQSILIPAPKTSRILPLSHSPDGAAADSADGTAGAAGSLLPQAWGARDRVRVLFLLRQGTAGRPVPQPPRQKAR